MNTDILFLKFLYKLDIVQVTCSMNLFETHLICPILELPSLKQQAF